MSDYTKITDFAAKDALAHLNPAKVITGTAHDNEYNAIATAVATKADKASPTFTGTVVLPSTTSIGNVSATELAYVDGVTSAIQTQMDLKAPLASPTFTGTVVLPSTTSIGSASSTEIGYLDGVTSAIQTQMNLKAPLAAPTFTGAFTATGSVDFSAGDVWSYGYLGSNGVGVYRFNSTGLAHLKYDGSTFIFTGGPIQIVSASASTFTGSITATAFNVSSDARKKSDVATITGALDKVALLRGVSFKYIASGVESLGFIAQEVAPVLPELVSADDQGFLSVNYGQMTAVLLEAVNELRAEVAALKAK